MCVCVCVCVLENKSIVSKSKKESKLGRRKGKNLKKLISNLIL